MDTERTTPRDIIIKIPKVKDKESLTARKKQRVLIRLSADFSKEILQARRDWKKVFKVMKSKDL